MFQSNQKKTIPELENIWLSCSHKWWQIGISTQRIQFSQQESKIRNLYKILGYQPPKIIFCDNPYIAWENIIDLGWQDIETHKMGELIKFLKIQLKNPSKGMLKDLVCRCNNLLKKPLESQLGIPLSGKLVTRLRQQINQEKVNSFHHEMGISKSTNLGKKFHLSWQDGINSTVLQIETQLNSHVLINILNKIAEITDHQKIEKALKKITLSLQKHESSQLLNSLGNLFAKSLFSRFCLKPELLAVMACEIDYYDSVVNCVESPREWKLWQGIISNTGWFFPYENFCFVSNHPIKYNFNQEYYLHGEGKKAIEFADGNGFYANQGVVIPPEYGKLNPDNWQCKWILTERNAEIRRILIEALGYERMALELEAEEIDSWQEYTLLRFNKIIDEMDEQPILLLKMICPSTFHTHVLRVPPYFTSAKEAIKWINWGISPEEIIMAT